jgi:DNA replication and repair protein RecF
MYKKVKIYQFRNFKTMTTVNLNSRNVVLQGSNGQGKTNFLEAIYYLSIASSFKEKKDSHIVHWDCQEFAVIGEYEHNGHSEKVVVNWQNGHKQIKIDDYPIKERKELIQRYPCFIFAHDDIRLADGEQEPRRRFFDQLFSFLEKSYIDYFKSYRLALKEKNASLKLQHSEAIDTYSKLMAQTGFVLNQLRVHYLQEFNQLFVPFIKKLIDKEIECQLEISWKGNNPDEIEAYLRSKRDYETKRATSLYGCHRDRYNFLLKGKEASNYLSVGERRALSMALKCVGAKMVSNLNGRKPILLLDDIFLELDYPTRLTLLNELPLYEQAFWTFLPHEEFIKNIKDPLILKVEQGVFQ